MSRVLCLCFVLSGAAALALEMLWMRSAGLVLGATAATTATVLACYFAGLGLGAARARRASPCPVRLYGWLEIGASAGALWSLFVFQVLMSEATQNWLSPAGALGRIAVVSIAILPTTLCFGATLPAIGQALAKERTTGQHGGLLYAFNTFGGVLGAAAAGFGLPVLIGVRTSYLIAACVSLLAGLTALTIGDGERRIFSSPERIPSSAAGRGHLRFIAAGAGALGLSLEVLWTRLFAQVLHNSVYSFTTITIVFLLAIALGALIAVFLLRQFAPRTIAAVALIIAAGSTVGGVWLFVYWTNDLTYFGMRSGLAEYLLRILALVAMTVSPTAIASGIVMPALWPVLGEHDSVAQALGDLSAANTFGGVLGAAATGFFLVSVLGIRGSLLVAAVSYLVLADLLAPPQSHLRMLTYGLLLFIVMADPLRAPLIHLRPEGETLHLLKEGNHGVVSVVETEGDVQLRLDNYYVLGGSAAVTNERRQGLLPLLLHPDPRHVAFIGLATGISASAGPALGVKETTVVELVPEVAETARAHFGLWNARLLERSDVQLILDDGRHYLAVAPEHFDVIVSDLFIPWHAGTGNLYAREMYDLAARRLTPGGLFCQWLPLYQLTREEFDIIAHTFLAVFPQVSLWRDDFYPDRPVVALVGQLTAQPVNLTRVREALRQLPDWSQDPQLATLQGFFMLYAGDLTAAADRFTSAALNTDDRPLIEFLAPRLTRINAAGDKNWFTGETLASFYDILDARQADNPGPLIPVSEEIRAARHAGTALFHYTLAAARHDDATAARFQAEVRTLVPTVIRAAEAQSQTPSVADSRQELIELRTKQEEVLRHLGDMQRRLRELLVGQDGAESH